MAKPQSVTVIEDGALYMCESLSEIIVPDGVESVEGRAFAGCKNLETITFGRSVNKIGYSALARCEKLQSIYIRATVPPTLEPHLFKDPDDGVPDVTIYVPMDSVDELFCGRGLPQPELLMPSGGQRFQRPLRMQCFH